MSSALQLAVLRTVLYADVFSFAMTPAEIHHFLIDTRPTSADDLQAAIDALALADRLLRRDALDEAALRLGLEAAVAAGDRQRARRTLATFRGHLLDELGMDPEPETLSLATRLGLDAS